ncbi:MAG: DUF1905 domain-containing protein [bacterium]|nr:DUF1905 domain-containing protein [bacterium]
MGKPLTFTAEIQGTGGGGAFVEIPFDVEKEFGSKRPKVKALIGGEPYRGTAVRMGTDCHLLLVLKGIREKIGKDIGDKVKVVLEVDADERVVEIPVELEKALKKNKTARDAFAKASYTTRKEYARDISGAKTAETRERRVAHVIEQLLAKSSGGEGEIPEELAKVLKKNKAARTAFEAMPPSHRKQYVGHILEAKQTETRTKRAEQSVEKILEWANKRQGKS